MNKIIPQLINYLIFIILLSTNVLYSQNTDTNQIISKLRKQYGMIINQKIENLKIVEIDNSYKPTEKEMEEAPSAAIEKIYIYHNEIDTYLIRKYNMRDEGGAFSHDIEEVLFWKGQPFFYYEKSYRSWNQLLKETRIYLDNNTVIQKLKKKTIVPWNELSKDFYDLQTDNQNIKVEKSEEDMQNIRYFIDNNKIQMGELIKK